MTRSEIMAKIKSKDTSIELMLRKALWSKGLRYRKNCKDIFGKPDICFKRKKIAIFCDSAFWQGKKFSEGEKFKTNSEFWERKILRNIERDKEVKLVEKKFLEEIIILKESLVLFTTVFHVLSSRENLERFIKRTKFPIIM